MGEIFSGISALTAFNRKAKGVNDGPCRYKVVKGIFLLESKRCWYRLRHYTGKIAAYSRKSSTRVGRYQENKLGETEMDFKRRTKKIPKIFQHIRKTVE